ncbi:hypothetical protein KIM322_14700 [Lactobacillus xylocopicola]|uniref:Uncharacterized protein n=1 Tax=Lactobacillus xylocopicola TaxID=2976676 RepID=A0ABN6SNI8_9LACO|nr:hypothetical protein KIM322_14700 [Lactobacillus xylocopicola]
MQIKLCTIMGFKLIFMTATGVILHIANGRANGRVDWLLDLSLMPGALIGAAIASRSAKLMAKKLLNI